MTPNHDALSTFYYEDSGPPEPLSSDYITLFLVHGIEFNCAIFRPLIPYAKQRNMRMVAINQRDFSGSSLYTAEELEALRSRNITIKAEALRAFGREIAEFIAAFIDRHNTPPISIAEDGRQTGGAALLYWSLGNIFLLSMLASLDKLPEGPRNLLSLHLRTAVFYDGATYIVGEDVARLAPGGLDWTSGAWEPFHNPYTSLAEKTTQFATVASTYFPPLSSPPSTLPKDLPRTMNMLHRRLPLRHVYEHDSGDTRDYTPTTLRMTDVQLESIRDPEYWSRPSTFLIRNAAIPQISKDHLTRALQIPNDNNGRSIWPHLKILSVWCDMTCPEIILSPSFISNRHSDLKKKGASVRPLKVEKLNGNHFVRNPYDLVLRRLG